MRAAPGFFFFFQAEDGIRDVAVTGVQTCALPISARLRPPRGALQLGSEILIGTQSALRAVPEIGRASCRERSVDLGGRRIIKKKKKRSLGNAVKDHEIAVSNY